MNRRILTLIDIFEETHTIQPYTICKVTIFDGIYRVFVLENDTLRMICFPSKNKCLQYYVSE